MASVGFISSFLEHICFHQAHQTDRKMFSLSNTDDVIGANYKDLIAAVAF